MPAKQDDRLSVLRKRVATSPTDPGIYRWLDENGRVLYVGKAKNLRKRLGSYVREQKTKGPWRRDFQGQIADFDVTVTRTELEALMLETNLIKQLRPKYNVLMKDDKNYLFIRVTLKDPYPRVETVRKMTEDGSKFFGPYLNSYEAYETLDMLHEILGYRACKESVNALNKDPENGLKKLRPCLEYQIGKCCGLCAGVVSHAEYRSRIDMLVEYLRGKKDAIRTALTEKMHAAAKDRKFEKAAKLRNYLLMLEGKKEAQVATDTTGEDSDVIGVALLSGRAHVVILHRRNGKLMGEAHFALSGKAESVCSVLEQFLPQYYGEGHEIPDMILLPETLDDDGAMHEFLREKRGKNLQLIIPERGRKSHLLMLAEKNAAEKARQQELKWEAEERNTAGAVEDLKEILNLPAAPRRIEGYDISHLGGTETVGSMVVACDGKAKNDQYRSFTIRTLKSGDIDDYKALQEVLKRRLRHLTEDLKSDVAQWKEKGLEIRKAKKAEAHAIAEIRSNLDLPVGEDEYKDVWVAAQEGEVIAMAKIDSLGKLQVLRSWSTPERADDGLEQVVVRAVLKTLKKGKIYLTVRKEREEYFAGAGFRYLVEAPDVLGMTNGMVHMLWEAAQNKVDKSLSSKPDLIMIDGGKGQLNAVVDVLLATGLTIPVIGLAKREEEVFVPGRPDPIPFPSDSPAKFLLMRLRDEAHRFSNRHRETRLKHTATASALMDIPGIGEETMKKLFSRFGSMSGMKEATDDELLQIVTAPQLRALRENL